MTYRTLIGNTNDDGIVSIASQRVTLDRQLAEELAEHWNNRMMGREHDAIGTLTYIAVQSLEEDGARWETLTEYEH